MRKSWEKKCTKKGFNLYNHSQPLTNGLKWIGTMINNHSKRYLQLKKLNIFTIENSWLEERRHFL